MPFHCSGNFSLLSLLLKKNPIIKYLKYSRLRKGDNLSVWEINNNNKKYKMEDGGSKPNKNFICRIQVKYDFFWSASLGFEAQALRAASYLHFLASSFHTHSHFWTNILTLEYFLRNGFSKLLSGLFFVKLLKGTRYRYLNKEKNLDNVNWEAFLTKSNWHYRWIKTWSSSAMYWYKTSNGRPCLNTHAGIWKPFVENRITW